MTALFVTDELQGRKIYVNSAKRGEHWLVINFRNLFLRFIMKIKDYTLIN